MTDDPTRPAPTPVTTNASRRSFLKTATAVAATAAAGTAAIGTVGCAPGADTKARTPSASGSRPIGFHRPLLGALGEVMLPATLGTAGRTAAVDAFVAWVDGYDPVAEQQHGYGYAEIRYLPADPAPGWRAQLDGLDVLARRMRQRPFVELDAAARQDVVRAALAPVRDVNMPDPLGASHIAVALVAHWAGSPAASDLAMGVSVGTGTCRPLDGVRAKPLPIVGVQG